MIDGADDPKALAPSTTDFVVSAARAALGSIPFAGSLIVELAGTFVPNQRIDRITHFGAALERRVARLEREYVRQQLRENEEFRDLFEESVRQAASTVSAERRDQIAELLANSLSSEELAYQESKHLLRVLGGLNNEEVIWLRFYLDPTTDGDKEFRERHQEVLRPASRRLDAPRSQLDRGAIQDSYKAHLAQLGLLKTETDRAGRPKYELSALGRLLLREIGLIPREDTD